MPRTVMGLVEVVRFPEPEVVLTVNVAAAPVSLDTFQPVPDAWRPAQPLTGETSDGTDWLDTLRNTLTSHPVYSERFQPLDDGLWRDEDHHGHTWTITFDRQVADASAGQVGLFVWGHPGFPEPG